MRRYSFKKRLLFLVFSVLALFIILMMRLFYLQVIQGGKWKEEWDRQYKSELVEKAKRGKIYSSDGEILAFDVETYEVVLDPTIIKEENIDEIIGIIKKNIPNADLKSLKQNILQKKKDKKRYLKIDDKISYIQKRSILDDLGKKKYLKLGVFFESFSIRNYTKNDVFKEVVGFQNSENEGLYGVEKYYNDLLKGKDGVVEIFKSPHGIFNLTSVSSGKEAKTSSENGGNVILTIDSVVQYTLDAELKKAYEQFSAESTSGVVLETETGKVLAMASYPKGQDNSQVKNRPITDLFEPGSIFKPLIVGMALQEKAISENEIITSNGWIKIADRTIKDHDSSTTGALTLDKVIANSSNVAMVKIAQKVDKKVFYSYLEKMRLNKKTGVDTYSEATPRMFTIDKFTEVRRANVSFGQGINMTQLQMIGALNSLVNNGKYMRPYVVDSIVNEAGETIKKNSPFQESVIFSPEVSLKVRLLMEEVVTKGTGKGAIIEGYRIGGKTGTAQKAGINGYEQGKYFSSFFGFFPVDKPKYTILVTINEPKGQYYGAQVALPSVKAIIEKMIKYKGINPEGVTTTQVDQAKKNIQTEQRDLNKINQEFMSGIMPNLKGLSLRELLSVYPISLYPNYEFVGSGRVSEQSTLQGSKLSKNTKIRIILK